jgi:hypothetical protein
MGWALLVWWYSVGLSPRARGALLAFVIATALVIPGIGEHYVVDLIAAVPFAVMIEAASALQIPMVDRRRLLPFAAGLVLMGGWVLFLRAGSTTIGTAPATAWTLTVFTIALPLFLRRELSGSRSGSSSAQAPAL